jgi:hypothetical protein
MVRLENNLFFRATFAPDMIILIYGIGAFIILGYSAAVATRRLPEREDAGRRSR